MAQDSESTNKDLYDLLNVRGYDPVPLNDENVETEVSQDSDVIQFNFVKDNIDYGKAWVTVDDSQITVYYSEKQRRSPSGKTPGIDYDDSWSGLLKFIKTSAQLNNMSFKLINKDRLGDDMSQRKYYKMKEKLGEGYHSMGKKASYNDAVPNVKIVLQHNRALEEGEQRYRNVARIFLENQDGERFLAPTTRPGIARVYARHIAEGGLPNDDRWNHIKTVCEDYNKMAGFVRATRGKEFNESAQNLINEGANHYSNLRETLSKLTGHRGYHAYFESWTPSLMEDEGDDISINELFVQETVDPRIESVMPILSKLRKNVAEMAEVDMLESWADSIISEKLELDEAPGAETLAHNQSTEKKNLKAFGLAEEDIDPTRPPRTIGTGKETFHATHPQTKEKLIVRSNHPQYAKELAAQEWNLKDSAGVLIQSEKTTSSSSPTSTGSALSNAQSATGNKTDKKPDEVKKGINVPPIDKDAWSNIGRLGIAAAGLSEDDMDENFIGMSPQAVAEGDVIPFKNKHIKKKHDDDDDDDSWIPSVEDFEQEEEIRNRKRGPANDLEEMDKSPDSPKFDPARLGPGNAPAKPIKLGSQGFKDMDDIANSTFAKAYATRKGKSKKEIEEAAENSHDIRHGGPYDRGQMDSYYGRPRRPHYYVGDTQVSDKVEEKDMTPDQIKAYHTGYNDNDADRNYKDWNESKEVEEGLDKNQRDAGQLGPTERVRNNNIGKLVGANESTEIDPELARIIEMARFQR